MKKNEFLIAASKFAAVLITASLLLMPPASAATWQEALLSAQKENNEIRSARKQADSAHWQYKKSMTTFLPQISANASSSKSKSGSTGITTNTYSYGISATQYLFKGFENFLNAQSAYANYEYALANLKAVEADAYYALRTAYIDLLIAQENVELQKEILERRTANTRLVRLRYESGIEDKGNYLLTKANRTQSEYFVKSAVRDLELAKLKLSQAAGRSIDAVDKLGSPASEELNADFDRLITASPAYLMAKYQLDQADIANKTTISEFLPSVSVSGNYSKSDSSWPPAIENKSVSLSLSYSLFPGGSNIADVFINKLNYEKAVQDFENNKKDIIYVVYGAVSGYKDALEQLSAEKASLGAKLERAKINQKKYLNGLVSYDDWDRIENDSIVARKSMLNSEKSAYYAHAALLKSYGGFEK